MQESGANEQIRDLMEVLKGANLTRSKVSQLEKRLKNNVEDLPSRLQLLGHFQRPPVREKFFELLVWLIKYKPESAIHEHLSIAQNSSAGYLLGKSEWLNHLRESPYNLRILVNFASYCALCEPIESIKYLRIALSKDPVSTEISFKLSEKLKNLSLTRSGDYAREAIHQFIESLDLHERNPSAFPYLTQYLDQTLSEYLEIAFKNSLIDEAEQLKYILKKRN